MNFDIRLGEEQMHLNIVIEQQNDIIVVLLFDFYLLSIEPETIIRQHNLNVSSRKRVFIQYSA